VAAADSFRASLRELVDARDEPGVRRALEDSWRSVVASVDVFLEVQGVHIDPASPRADADRRLELATLGRDELWDRLVELSGAVATLLRSRERLDPDLVGQYLVDAAGYVERATGDETVMAQTMQALGETGW
jgi:hypothetical protein